MLSDLSIGSNTLSANQQFLWIGFEVLSELNFYLVNAVFTTKITCFVACCYQKCGLKLAAAVNNKIFQ
jgi:hypothetical protein